MILLLYRCLTRLIYVLIYPWARWQAARGNEVWRGRLVLDQPSDKVALWMHAASVGEIRILGNLAAFLVKARPALKIHVTAVTHTGVETARSIMPPQISISYFPLDVYALCERVLQRLKPRMIVVAETEIWPNLIGAANRLAIPMVLVNGRLSERSYKKYRMISRTFHRLIAAYDRFFFKSEADRGRYLSFGLPSDKGVVAGDMKFDAPMTMKSKEFVNEIRAEVGLTQDQFMLVAGSTRPGEEEILLAVAGDLRKQYPQLRLVLAPRHLERLNEIHRLIDESGLAHCHYGDGRPCDGVTLVDRMGLLNDLYLAADLAFVGGTLVDIGGHNVLEPVWARTPVLFGPSTYNVPDAAEYIIANNFGAQVANADELRKAVEDVLLGRRKFAAKEETDTQRSATALAGTYILKRLSDA